MKPPAYRARLTTGIVHFGPGAFHRAHQADYIHRLLHEDPRWGIAAASLRTRGTIDALKEQDGLYTLAILDSETSFRTIGAHTSFFGPTESEAVRRQLLDPNVRIVSSTVTEKGYCLSGDGTLDFAHSDIAHDLGRPQSPRSIVGWLALGLADRRSNGLAPFVPLCCDNMVSNGKKLRAAVLAFAERIDRELARWIAGEARFPDTMVDSITPATDDRLRELVHKTVGVEDRAPVAREAFSQWVIEDNLPEAMPDLASVGVELAADVCAWERAKLRILNGAHSTIAYTGLLLGYETVSQAMDDPGVSEFVRRLIIDDVVPTLEPSPLDLSAYAAATVQRFRNPAIHHRLSQIAWDGSQKLPYRLLDTIADARTAGRPVSRLAVPIASWILFIERQTRTGADIVDPLADKLRRAASVEGSGDAFLDLREIFPLRLATDTIFRNEVVAAVEAIRSRGVRNVLRTEPAAG